MNVPRAAAKRPRQHPRVDKSGVAKVVSGKGRSVAAAQARELDERLGLLKAKVQALNDNADQLLALLADTARPKRRSL